MFYSNQILARKGPLGLVWIAAHMEGRLKRQQINSTSISASVDTLMDPEVPLALRLSGQLLLGVVRIYARKVAYLQQDCDAALIKIRVALRPADNCNLPPGSQVAPVEAITMLDPAAAAAVAERARKARTTKGVADGKNNAAAGGAAVVDGWLGPVDEDGLMLGLDDISWDQELLLGENGEPGFGLGGLRFEPNSRLSFGLAPSRSGLGSQDISGVFGMYSSQDGMQETFDLEDEEAAAVWDLDDIEVERLRAAPSQSQRDSLGGVSGLLGGDTPAGGLKQGAKSAAAADGDDAEGSLSGGGPLGGNGFTPGSLAADEAEPYQADPNPLDSMDLDINPADDAMLPTPAATTPRDRPAAAAGGDAAALQHDPYDLDQISNLGDVLPPTPAADDDAAVAAAAAAGADSDPQPATAAAAVAAAGGTPTKTFQRRNTRQQAEEAEGADEGAAAAGEAAAEGGEGTGAKERVAPMTAAKSARRRRVSGLLGLKRRVMIDVGDAAASRGGVRSSGTRHAVTELPAAEIRALLADRASLMDMERVHKVSKQLQHQAASSLTAQGAAALAQQQLLAIAAAAAAAAAPTATTAAAAAGPTSPPGRGTAASASAVAAVEVAAVVGTGGLGAAVPGLPGTCVSLSACFAGGLGLPAELQQLFSNAAAAAPAATAMQPGGESQWDAAATAAGGEAGAVAPTAPLEEIGGMEDAVEGLEGFVGAGALHPNLADGGTHCSLSLSLMRTPGSIAAGGLQPTPGTDAAGRAGAYTPGMPGYTPGAAGYTPGSAHDLDGVLQPLDDVNMFQDDVNQGQDDVAPEAWAGQVAGDEKENAPGSGVGASGKGGAAAGGACAGRIVWPADAETLVEQEAAEHEVPDGSFTARTRLVVRHLQHAAATASGGASAGMTPTVGGKRRISAAAAGLATGAAAAGKGVEGGAEGTAAASGPVLSFEGITKGHSRLDACRWFYEVLVLSNKGLVNLQQDESYGDISVRPDLAGMARV